MIITDRLKQIIFKQLYRELGDCEIIPHNGSIWFINRDNKHWYLELDKSGTLWWRYDFFNSFFQIFSMSSGDFCPVLSSWVEDVLNHKVSTTVTGSGVEIMMVEDVLNHKVSTTCDVKVRVPWKVEDVLSHNVKVSTTTILKYPEHSLVEKVLNHKVSTTNFECYNPLIVVEKVLNHRVSTTSSYFQATSKKVEEVLNQ